MSDNPYLQHRKKDVEKARFNDDNFDKNLIRRKRSKIQLKMNAPGKYIQKAKKEKLQERIEQRKETVQLKQKENEKHIREHWSLAEVPEIEWWDNILVFPHESYDKVDPSFAFDKPVPQLATIEEPNGTIPITHLILHPLLPPQDGKPLKIPMYLTKPEIKRIRRLRRLEDQRERRDQVLLGEITEEPKLTLTNFTKVLSPEILQDPTKAEQMVRDQIEDRQEKHLLHNKSQKLTKEQRSEKFDQKWQKDRKKGLQRVVYKLNKMNFKIKNKIDWNANQMHMTGVLIWFKNDQNEEFCLLVVEGGRIACNKMSNLICRRINWNKMTATTNQDDEDAMEIDEKSEDEMNLGVDDNESYELKWKSDVKSSIFVDKIGTFRVKTLDNDSIDKYLEYIGEEMVSYWKLVN